eukprot:COSAG02_NODE_4512_length_5277_cov_2.807455_5_plen_153_part_00
MATPCSFTPPPPRPAACTFAVALFALCRGGCRRRRCSRRHRGESWTTRWTTSSYNRQVPRRRLRTSGTYSRCLVHRLGDNRAVAAQRWAGGVGGVAQGSTRPTPPAASPPIQYGGVHVGMYQAESLHLHVHCNSHNNFNGLGKVLYTTYSHI